MGKFINDNQILGDLGESFIRSVVLKMGHVFECVCTDAGLDGTIELRAATGEMMNLILRAQVKATGSFKSESEISFSFTCSPDNIEYCMKGNTPSLLIVCDPRAGVAYPGLYVPRTLLVRFDHTSTPQDALCTDILQLTKMNWNNCQIDELMPFTIRAARQVGSILKHVPEGDVAEHYKFYM